MAINIFSNAGATIAVSPTEYFTGNGVLKAFTITKFTGSTATAVYQEDRTSIASVVFTNGVTGTLATMVASEYIGYAVYHQVNSGTEHVFRGYVTANTTTVITISDATYNAGADTLILVKYNKLSAISDYTIAGQTLTLLAVDAPATGIKIYVVGATPANMNFGDSVTAIGTDFDQTLQLWIKRDPLYAYSSIQISSDNLSQTAQTSVWSGAAVASGIITLGGSDAFAGVNSEVGKAVNREGVFIGVVVANDAAVPSTATLDTLTYTNATAGSYTFYTVGELLIAPDTAGSPDITAWAKVMQGGTNAVTGTVCNIPATIDDDTVYPFWVKGTIPIPTVATNYAENIIKISATEYLA